MFSAAFHVNVWVLGEHQEFTQMMFFYTHQLTILLKSIYLNTWTNILSNILMPNVRIVLF